MGVTALSTYYVSAQRGSNGNAGTSQAAPWATLAYAATQVAAGDTVYVGGGSYYREQVTLSTSGTSGSPIYWIGDPTSRFVTSDRKGRIHLTRFDTSWLPQSGAALIIGSVAYNYFYDFTIDGSTGGTVTSSSSTVDFYRCNIQGQTSGYNGLGDLYDCFVSAGDTAVLGGARTFRCVLSGGGVCAQDGDHYSSLALAGEVGFWGGNCYSCTVCGGAYGFVGDSSRSNVSRNCSAMNTKYGFYGSATYMTLTNCGAVQCLTGFYGTSTGAPLVLTACRVCQCNLAQRGGGYESGTPTVSAAVHYDWFEARRALEPWYCQTPASGLRNTGNNTYTVDYDVQNRARPLGNGTTDIGAWEYSDYDASYVVGDYQALPPALKFHRANQQIFYIACEQDKRVTVTCKAKHNGASVGQYPRVLLRGRGITQDSDVMTAGADTWQTLTVTADTTEDAVLEFICYAVDPTTNIWAYFSDFNTTVSPVSEEGVEYGSATLSGQAATSAYGTAIPGGVGGEVFYGNPFNGTHSANNDWFKAGYYICASFTAPISGAIDQLSLEWKISSGYGAGNYGRYTVRIYPADANGFPTGTAIGETTNWYPTTEGRNLVSISATLTAGTRYAIRIYNTYSPASTNYASWNTLQTELGPTGTILAPTSVGRTLRTTYASSGYFDGGMECRMGASTNGTTWSPWSSTSNVYSGGGNTSNGSHAPIAIRYTSGSAWYGNGYYSASGSGRVRIYGTSKAAQWIPAWPFGTISAVGILVCLAGEAPSDSCGYAIESGGSSSSSGTIVRSGTLCAPFNDGAYVHRWKEVNFSSPLTLTAGNAYRVALSQSGGGSSNCYSIAYPYHESYSEHLATSFAGAGSIQTTTGTTWSSPNGYADMPFLFKTE